MYTAKDIRNICLLGHGGDGKSALAESMLFLTKAIDRLGKRTDGNTTSDFDPEEIKRGYSISTAVLPVEYNKCKLNILDNPGYFAFSGEVAHLPHRQGRHRCGHGKGLGRPGRGRSSRHVLYFQAG